MFLSHPFQASNCLEGGVGAAASSVGKACSYPPSGRNRFQNFRSQCILCGAAPSLIHRPNEKLRVSRLVCESVKAAPKFFLVRLCHFPPCFMLVSQIARFASCEGIFHKT